MSNLQTNPGARMSYSGPQDGQPVCWSRKQKIIVVAVPLAVAAILTPIAIFAPYPSTAKDPQPQPVATRPVDDTIIVNGLLGGLPF